jgi:hypothetical protein
MKIFIDPDDAGTSNFGTCYQSPIIDNTGCRLPIAVGKQVRSRWCWAAIASAVAGYYKTRSIDQVQLVDSLLPPALLEKNVNFKLDVALKYVNCFSHWTIGKPIFDRIQFEINQGRPLGVRLEWFTGGAHYILVNGYNDRDGSIMIEDPLHGPGVHVFELFPDHYRGPGAVWTETFWTNKINNP